MGEFTAWEAGLAAAFMTVSAAAVSGGVRCPKNRAAPRVPRCVEEERIVPENRIGEVEKARAPVLVLVLVLVPARDRSPVLVPDHTTINAITGADGMITTALTVTGTTETG